MILPVIPILTSALGSFIKSKLPKQKSMNLGEAIMGEAVTRLIPKQTTTNAKWHESIVIGAGKAFGVKLLELIKPGKWEKIGERSVGKFFRAAADKLDPQ